MALVNITEAARLTAVSEKTIRRKISSGELSAQVQGQGGQARKVLDTSELLRVFGSLPGHVQAIAPPESPPMSTQPLDITGGAVESFQQIIETQKVLITVLQSQLDARTQETRELRAQVTGLLEWRKPETVPHPAPIDVSAGPAVPNRKQMTLSKNYLIGVLSLATAGVLAWAWISGYRI